MDKVPLYAGVLVGGQGRRMGRSKALLALHGSSLVEQVVEVLRTHVRAIYLLGNAPMPCLGPVVDQIPDVPDVEGPMAGMLAAMRRAPHACWMFVACDMPLVHSQAIDWLIGQRAPGRSAILPRIEPEGVEPLLAIYAPAALALLERLAARGIASAQKIVEDPSVATPIVPRHLRSAWVNVNTPDQLRQIERMTGT
jgi:molybdopterin-guanine dinucleotide biosynthesis protein A